MPLDSLDYTTLRARFRDDDQQRDAQDVLALRLADDRIAEECRYILRFCWQLAMSYVEVTPAQLEHYVAPAKLAEIEALLDALAADHDAIDRWVARCMATLPLIEDRTYEAGTG